MAGHTNGLSLPLRLYRPGSGPQSSPPPRRHAHPRLGEMEFQRIASIPPLSTLPAPEGSGLPALT